MKWQMRWTNLNAKVVGDIARVHTCTGWQSVHRKGRLDHSLAPALSVSLGGELLRQHSLRYTQQWNNADKRP